MSKKKKENTEEVNEVLEPNSKPESSATIDEVNNEADEVSEDSNEPKKDELSLKSELEESKDKYLRLYSEFENFRRRTNKEKYENIAQANSSLLGDLLPVLDDIERANKALKETEDKQAWEEGVELIFQKFGTTLTQKGVKKMDALHKPFDPDFHEAVTQIPAPEKKLKGKVVDVIEEGYFLNDKILRFAKVVIGQ